MINFEELNYTKVKPGLFSEAVISHINTCTPIQVHAMYYYFKGIYISRDTSSPIQLY